MPFFTSFSGKILSAPGLKLGPKIFQFIKTFTSNVQEYNLRTDLLANGWDGVMPVSATLTVNSGIYIWSNSTSTAAFNTGTIVSNSIISIINNGYIIGKGGNGSETVTNTTFGATPPSAENGGPAINLNYPVSITNNSYIAGGGGGGRGGFGGGGGGAGGGNGGALRMGSSITEAGGAGGAPGQTGSNGTYRKPTSDLVKGSGGGGGRIIPGTGGAGGSFWNSDTDSYGRGGQEGGGGGGGRSGDVFDSGGGAYGAGGGGRAGGGAGSAGTTNYPAATGTTTSGGTGQGDQYYPGGGGGGAWGASGGGASSFNQPTYAGGTGGKAVNLNGNTVTWIATGTIYGAIS